MEQNAAVFLKVRTRDGLASRTIGIEGRRPQYDVLAVERAVALANRHRCLLRVVPHRGEAIRFGIEAGNARTGALLSIGIDEGEIRLKKLPALDHVLFTRAFRYDRLSVRRKERLDDIPVARKLRQQLLTRARRIRRLIFIVSLLRGHRSGNEQCSYYPFPHGTPNDI